MWPWKKKKPTEKKEPSESEKVLAESKRNVEDITLLFKHGVTRFDESEAYLKALIELHPEVKEHPAILDLRKREEEYQAEKAKRN